MKLKHNKKRNTAFIYEALVKELTKSVIKKDNAKKNKILSVIKEGFSRGSALSEELRIFSALATEADLEKNMVEKLIMEARFLHKEIDQAKLFKEQTKIINRINKELSSAVFSNFVPNYKHLATIAQIFDKGTSIKDRIILENRLIKSLMPKSEQEGGLKPIDNLIYSKFVEKFNDKYSNDRLHEEQKSLLNHYITSFADNGIKFKIFLNEELGRLKDEVKLLLTTQEISEDQAITSKVNEVLSTLRSFSDRDVDAAAIRDILHIQNLVREAQSDANSD